MTEAPLWTIREICAATGARFEGGEPDAVISGVSIDSRTIGAGELFVAIAGENHDGHDFVESAFARGAAAAIVSKAPNISERSGPLLIVPDALKALEAMGRAARERSSARVIAVTGSVGKTGTKEMLRLCLAGQGSVHASVASYNNHWGVPLSLARLPRRAGYAVFEIGMNHPGEITPLTGLVRPHIAIVTAVAESHLGHFDSLAGIARAKAEIFSGLEPGGAAVINRDSEFFPLLEKAARQAKAVRVVGFGESPKADSRLMDCILKETSSVVSAEILGQPLTYHLGAPGKHLVMNSLAALTAAGLAGADLALCALKLRELVPPQGRGARFLLAVPDGHLTLIDESYNANPASVRAALALLRDTAPTRTGRRIAILGDMLELGVEERRLHAELAGAIEETGVDIVHACGPLMAHLWSALTNERRGIYADTSHELCDRILADLRAGDVVMVKGSLGSRMKVIVEALRDRFAVVDEHAA